MTGRLEKVSSLKAAPGQVQPLASSANGDYRCADEYSVIGNWYYYFAIGNCRPGWEIAVVSYASENTVTHEHSYGGFVNNAFSGCGWIDTRFPIEKLNGDTNSACAGGGSSREFKVEESSFMERYNRGTEGDGNPVVNTVPCSEYANYRPWSSNNVEKELIRTVPAYAASGPGSNYPALKWRYITKYSSTDGTGKYVMVRDDRITGAGEGNWVFVPRSCLPASLPENAEERLPPPPTAVTGGFGSVTPTSVSLAGSVNPNGLETHYYIEWGREANTPYEAFAPTPYPGEDVGAGHEVVNRSVTATGLKPGTLYYYRIVAQSPTGTSEGGEQAFTTDGPVEAITGTSRAQQKQATLLGTVKPRGYPATYYFQYGPTTNYGSATPVKETGTGEEAVQAAITGLNPGTTYHFRLVATSGGITSEGQDQSFETGAPPSLTLGKPTQSSITLSWTASAGAVNYTVLRDGSPVATTSALTYTDSNLHPTTFYHYEVAANWEGESGYSNTVTRATTPLGSVTADITGDGKTDLPYIYPGGYVDSFLSNGNGTYTWTEELIESGFNTETGLWLTGDVTGNGKGDLIYIYPGGYIDTFLSNGNGTYTWTEEQVSKEFESNNGTWEVADVTGNGKDDLIYIYPGGYIDTFLSNGNGTYEEKQEQVSKEFDDTTGKWFTGDFNGDGKADLAYIYPGGYIDTFLSSGNGTYEEKQELIESGFNTETGLWLTGDVTGNGKDDLIYIYPGGYVDSFLSNGNGTYSWTEELIESGFNDTSGIWRTGDVTGNGKDDLIYIYPGGYVDSFLPEGSGTYEEKSELIESGFNDTTGFWL